mgnify:CR=1 FL=1
MYQTSATRPRRLHAIRQTLKKLPKKVCVYKAHNDEAMAQGYRLGLIVLKSNKSGEVPGCESEPQGTNTFIVLCPKVL